MNIGVAASSSTFVVIHDDDDSWAPTFLEETVGVSRGAQGRQAVAHPDRGGLRADRGRRHRHRAPRTARHRQARPHPARHDRAQLRPADLGPLPPRDPRRHRRLRRVAAGPRGLGLHAAPAPGGRHRLHRRSAAGVLAPPADLGRGRGQQQPRRARGTCALGRSSSATATCGPTSTGRAAWGTCSCSPRSSTATARSPPSAADTWPASIEDMARSTRERDEEILRQLAELNRNWSARTTGSSPSSTASPPRRGAHHAVRAVGPRPHRPGPPRGGRRPAPGHRQSDGRPRTCPIPTSARTRGVTRPARCSVDRARRSVPSREDFNVTVVNRWRRGVPRSSGASRSEGTQ